MAEANPKVMEMVEAELRKDPDISNPQLLEKAKGIDKNVGKLTARQFNAIYPLQVKRGMKPRKRGGGGRKAAAKKRASGGRTRTTTTRAAAGGPGRDQIRTVLLQLAKDVAGAEGKGDVVDVIAGIDRYVDRVQKAAG